MRLGIIGAAAIIRSESAAKSLPGGEMRAALMVFMLTMWSKAREMAVMTPPERNRWVDFLRAMSIMAVVVGHWLMNGMIMTVYLWHLTAFVLVMTVLRGWGLEPVPGTGEWWITRPLWIAIYILALLPMIAVFARHERSFGPVYRPRNRPGSSDEPPELPIR